MRNCNTYFPFDEVILPSHLLKLPVFLLSPLPTPSSPHSSLELRNSHSLAKSDIYLLRHCGSARDHREYPYIQPIFGTNWEIKIWRLLLRKLMGGYGFRALSSGFYAMLALSQAYLLSRHWSGWETKASSFLTREPALIHSCLCP